MDAADLRQFVSRLGAAALLETDGPQPNGRRLGGRHNGPRQSRRADPRRCSSAPAPTGPIHGDDVTVGQDRGDLEGLAGAPQPLADVDGRSGRPGRGRLCHSERRTVRDDWRRVTARGSEALPGPGGQPVSAWSRRANPAGSRWSGQYRPLAGSQVVWGIGSLPAPRSATLPACGFIRGVADRRSMPLAAGWPCSVGWTVEAAACRLPACPLRPGFGERRPRRPGGMPVSSQHTS